MAITCTWSVNDMTHVDSDGGVILVYWSSEAKSDGDPIYTANDGNKLHCEPDPESPDYIQYADLTEDDVLNWVYASLVTTNEEGITETPEQAKARVEAELTAKVQGQIDRASTQSTGLPWETSPE